MATTNPPNALNARILGRQSFTLVLGVVCLLWFTGFRVLLAAWTAFDTGLSWSSLPGIFARGALYDALFVLYATAPIALWSATAPEWLWRSRFHRTLGWVVAFFALYGLLFTSAAEALFWEEFSVRFNFIAIDYLVYTHEVINNIMESYPMVPILVGLGVVAASLLRLLRRPIARALQQTSTGRQRLASMATLLTVVVLSVWSVDQRLWRRSSNPYVTEISSNGPYQLFAAFRKNELDFEQFYPTLEHRRADAIVVESMESPGSHSSPFADSPAWRAFTPAGPQRRLNVVLVMVESLSARFMARFGGDPTLTPRVDALAEQGLSFEQFYATGTRTTRGLEAVTLSIPPTPGRSIVKRLGRETGYRSLGTVFGERGYEVEFHYGGRGYFDNMNAFFAGNGYTTVDQSNVPEDEIQFENAWGMADEDLYTQVLARGDRAHNSGEPFFFHVMTTSNHRPYTFPEGRVALASGSGRNAAVQYTDWAIGDLIDRASQRPWFDDTVFVIVADHCASSAGKVDLPIERYHIPCILYCPKHIAPERIETIGGQIDLAPTLLGLMGSPYEAPFFGRDLRSLPADQGRAFVGTYQVLGLYDGGVMTTLSPVKRAAQRVERATGSDHAVAIEDAELLDRCIAYYQVASDFFRDHPVTTGLRIASSSVAR